MNIDLWSMIREARHVAWDSAAMIYRGIFDSLVQMLIGGDPLQATLALLFIVSVLYASWRGILKLLYRSVLQ